MNQLTAQRAFTRLAVEPLTPTIGAEISGVDLSAHLDDETIAEIRAALLAHKVIFFRDQQVTRAQHIAFARRFGELEIHPATPADQPDREVLNIAHGPQSKGRENNWHSDVTWRAEPSLGSILRAAFRGLSPAMQEWLRSLTAVHDIARVFAGRLGKDPAELHAKYPPQVHPVVRTHPETGEQALYVNTGFTSHIEGLSAKESEWLLKHLYSQASLPEYQCRFRWRAGSIAFWDNRAAQHYAASDYFPAVRRMERVTIAGDRPFYRDERTG
jgi:taurine dioxygenase